MSTRLLPSLWSSNGGYQTCTLAFDSLCGAQTGVAKRAIAFDSLCGGRMGVPKCRLSICVERNED